MCSSSGTASSPMRLALYLSRSLNLVCKILILLLSFSKTNTIGYISITKNALSYAIEIYSTGTWTLVRQDMNRVPEIFRQRLLEGLLDGGLYAPHARAPSRTHPGLDDRLCPRRGALGRPGG